MKKNVLFLIFALIPFFLTAQQNAEQTDSSESINDTEIQLPEVIVPAYDLGDQVFGLNVGGILPLAIYFFSDGSTVPLLNTNHYAFPLGGMATLEWNGFLDAHNLLGFEITGMFGITHNSTHTMVPITFSYTYLIDLYPITIMLSPDIGVIINKLDEITYFGPVAKLGISVYYKTGSEWDLGGNIKYWFVPEVYFGNSPLVGQNSIGSFLEISFSALYHF